MVPEKTTVQEGFLFEESGFTAQLCNTTESREIAYRLRYRAYRSVDGIPENDTGMAIDKYDLQNNARTHLIWYEGKAVASIRSLIWSEQYNWQSTTSLDAFRFYIKKELGLDQSILESNRYVVDPEFKGRKSLTAQFLLFRVQNISFLHDQCRYLITAVRPKHAAFYKRVMNFDPISDPIRVKGFQFDAVLLASCPTSTDTLVKSAPIAKVLPEDRERYRHELSAQKKMSNHD